MKSINIILLLLFSSLAFGQVSSQWPREFHNVDGTVTIIPAPPKKILSTSVTVTGTLLSIDAPVIASATDVTGSFFGQWEPVAKQRNVKPLWPAGSVDLESVYLEEPDLIIVSITGADSAIAQFDEFSMIAPTIVVDYSNQSWQKLAIELGYAIGIEQKTQNTIDKFNDFVSSSRSKMKLPDGQANIISYYGAGVVNAVAKADGAHAQLLEDLGFSIESPDPSWQASSISHRDFLRIPYENLTLLVSSTTFLLASSSESDTTNKFLNDPILQNIASIKSGQVYGLGLHSFRIDLYSATEIVNDMLKRYAIEQVLSL